MRLKVIKFNETSSLIKDEDDRDAGTITKHRGRLHVCFRGVHNDYGSMNAFRVSMSMLGHSVLPARDR